MMHVMAFFKVSIFFAGFLSLREIQKKKKKKKLVLKSQNGVD